MTQLLQKLRPTPRQAVLLIVFAILITAGGLVYQSKKNDKIYYSSLFSINSLRLETRARLRDWATNHPGEKTMLADLGLTPSNGVETKKHIVILSQDDSHNVVAIVHKKGRPDKVLLKTGYTWAEWIGPDFEFTWP